MRRTVFILCLVHLVVGVRGMGRPQPWVRFVIKLSGMPPFAGDSNFNTLARTFLGDLLDAGEADETEALAVRESCRSSLTAIVRQVLQEEAKTPRYLAQQVVQKMLPRVEDGSFKRVLYVPFETATLYRYLVAKKKPVKLPRTFALYDKGMREAEWLWLLLGLMRKAPLSRDPRAIELVSRYQDLLLASPHNDEIAVLLQDADARIALSEALAYIFQSEWEKTVWGYSPEFSSSLLNVCADGSFARALSTEEGLRDMLAYVRRGMAKSSAAVGSPRPTIQVYAVSVTCVLTVALWSRRVVPSLRN